MADRSIRSKHLGGVLGVLIVLSLGAGMLTPVTAAPNDPATQRFVKSRIAKLRKGLLAKIAAKADATSVYKKAETYTKSETHALLPDAFASVQDGPFAPSGTGRVGNVIVPAGSYIVEAKLYVTTSGSGPVTCSLHRGLTKLDETKVSVGGTTSAASLSLLGSADASLDATVLEVRCSFPASTQGHFLRIIAQQVDDLTQSDTTP